MGARGLSIVAGPIDDVNVEIEDSSEAGSEGGKILIGYVDEGIM